MPWATRKHPTTKDVVIPIQTSFELAYLKLERGSYSAETLQWLLAAIHVF